MAEDGGAGTRERIVAATAALLHVHGYAGTGMKAISAAAGAPFGSLYHFFPGGKAEMAAHALRWSADGYARRVGEALADGSTAAEAVARAFDGAAETLAATDYVDACPIATVALEVASSNEALRAVTAEILDGWLWMLDRFFERAGVERAAARDLSTLFLAGLEGGFLLARAARDPEPLRAIGRNVSRVVAAAVSVGARAPAGR